MLQFMEHLEKHLYNAYEGAAVSMPTLPKVGHASHISLRYLNKIF